MELRTAEKYSIYAHNFIPDDLSSFLGQVYRLRVELSLTNKNFPTNISLALQHAENTADLMDDVLYMDDSRDDKDFIEKYSRATNNNNATIKALVIANIADQVLIEYGKAYDIDYDPTNMSNMLVSSNDSNDIPILSNVANYQSSLLLSEMANYVFRTLPLPTENINDTNNKVFVSAVEKNLVELNDLVKNNATIQDLMILVHRQLHPNLQVAYDLTSGYMIVRDIVYGGERYNITLISYYDEIQDFSYDHQTRTISWTIPFDWNSTRIQNKDIFVHEEIVLPKSFEQSGLYALFKATVNNEPLGGRALTVDPFSVENATVIHYLINKNQIFELSNNIDIATDATSTTQPKISSMNFSLSLK